MLNKANGGPSNDGVKGNYGPNAGAVSGSIDLGASATPLTIDKSNVTDIIVRASQCLDEQNVPEGGRFMIIPAWMCAKIKTSELKDASLTGDGSSTLRNGRLGMVDRFTLYMSNLLPANATGGLVDGETAIYFGTTTATTFASQVTKVETLRLESTFATVMRGLQVYGREVIKDECLGQIIATQP